MIPILFHQELQLDFDDGVARRFLAAPLGPTDRLDPQRTYLALEETLAGLDRTCQAHGLPPPLRLPAGFLAGLTDHPLPLPQFLARIASSPPARISIGLINGGGGGLGDGIMFAPAIDILIRHLRALGCAEIEIAVYSLLPGRTESILGRLPGLTVRALPCRLADFLSHDAFADFSGMLGEPDFATTHLTDFTLRRLGLDPDLIPAADKEPFLTLAPDSPPLVAAGLALARRAAGGRSLVAVIVVSAYTRTMPRPLAAALIRRLAEAFCPVLLFPAGWPGAAFVSEQDLTEVAVDLSFASPSFADYFAVLAGVDAIVSVDTSAVHIGAAFGKPTVAIFNSIDQTTRIRYSPTVHGIQLRYQGKHCQAPCGLSKARAYLEGRTSTGQPFRLECGYACDEAVDREVILDETIAALRALPLDRQTAAEREAIRLQMADRFHAQLAPCWQALDLEMVTAGLVAIRAQTEDQRRQPCPVCGLAAVHRRIGRCLGRNRLLCDACQAVFAGPGPDSDRLAAAHPVPSPADGLALAPLLSRRSPRLAVSGLGSDWPEDAWLDFLRATGSTDHVLWQRGAGPMPPAPVGGYQAIVVLTRLEAEPRPAALLTELLARLSPDGLLVLVAANRQNPGQGVKAAPAGDGQTLPGWTRQTMTALLAGLDLVPLWLQSTALDWASLDAASGPLPTLHIQPPGQSQITVRLEGRDLARPVGSHLAQVLQSIRDHGPFWLCCAQPRPRGEHRHVGTE